MAAPDEAHLDFAARNGRVLCTGNFGDFLQLHWQWIATGKTHAGMILLPQQRYSVGEQVRRLAMLCSLMEPEDIAGRYEFLRDWAEE